MFSKLLMRRQIEVSVTVVNLLAMALLFALSVPCACDEIKQEMTTAVAAVRPALIRIFVVSTDYSEGRESKTESMGSGVIISPEGYAITNHHVAMDAESIVCTLADKKEVDAKLIGTDPLADIAVIKLISKDNKPFPYASFGDSSKLEVGDRVFAMGCPYAISQSVTMGIVSNIEMVLPKQFAAIEFTLDGEDVGSIVRWIGHDSLIEPGNSGGPLVNRDGQIVGINEISFGLAGAIPSNLARDVAEQLIKNGKVTRSWLGLDVQPLLESSKIDKGILVSGVMGDSPAQKAGFKSGDILLSLDGQEVDVHFREQMPLFNQFVAGLAVGKTADAKILRDGSEMTLNVTTAERKKAMDKQHELKNWGICATNITYLMQKEMELDSQEGALVISVLPSGAAGSAKPSLRGDDVIVKVGGETIRDVADLRAITKKLTEGKTEPVSVIVNFDRKQKQFATVVKIGKNEESDSGEEISKAWLAIDMQVITRELADALGVPGKTGVRVTQVYPKSAAETAGLKVGDLVLKLDGEEIPAEQMGDEEVLPSLIRQYDIGVDAKLSIVRDGKPMDIMVKLETSPKLSRDYPKYEDESFEFIARDIAFSDKADGGVIESQSGAYIESTSEGSWVALGGLRSGDIIADVNGTQIKGLSDLKVVMADIAQKKPTTVVFKVERGIHTLFLEVKPSWQESE